tara:strand:- start:575 stop:748 length:174 start_codon:yes stop_codon:yes gene_type:complete
MILNNNKFKDWQLENKEYLINIINIIINNLKKQNIVINNNYELKKNIIILIFNNRLI